MGPVCGRPGRKPTGGGARSGPAVIAAVTEDGEAAATVPVAIDADAENSPGVTAAVDEVRLWNAELTKFTE